MGIFHYTPQKPGKGVYKNTPKLRRPLLFFSLMFEKIWDFFKMSLLFSLSCIPIITIGPSICALTYFSRSVTDETHMFLWSDYWDCFKSSFFKGIIISFINFIPMLSLYIVFVNMNAFPMLKGFLFPLITVNIIMIIMSFYVYPIYISYNVSLFGAYKNSFIFAMIKLPVNFLVTVIYIAVVLMLFWFSIYFGILLCIFFFFSFLNYLSTFLAMPTIEKYMGGLTDNGE